MASAATSELRRPMGDAPRERRDRAGLGGFTRSVALSSESKEEGPVVCFVARAVARIIEEAFRGVITLTAAHLGKERARSLRRFRHRKRNYSVIGLFWAPSDGASAGASVLGRRPSQGPFKHA